MGLEDSATAVPLSNLVFVTNLLDVQAQGGLRRDRHIREAEQSAGQFFAVLNELLLAGDEAALLTFLNFCNIPLTYVSRLPEFRPRPTWEGREGMLSLGERNLHLCKTLHEATLRFFDRHAKKLKKHTQHQSLDGISNFLHIFLSMGTLLRMHIERALVALEAKTGPASTEEWADCRMLWDTYFLRFRELMTCLWDDYLKPLRARYEQEEIHQEVGQDLDAMHELCDQMIRFRIRIEQVRGTRLVRTDPDGRKWLVPYSHSILGQEAWGRYATYTQLRQKRIEMAVRGHATHEYPAIG